jgi:hypothetical protein
MNTLGNLLACLALVLSSAHPKAKEAPIDLAKIANAFHFPAKELAVQNVTEEFKKIDGDGVFAAYKVSSKVPFGFYPLLITFAREGTFVTAEFQVMLAAIDPLPDLPLIKGGRGPLGSMKLGENIVAGLSLGEIPIPVTQQPYSGPVLRMALFSAATLRARQMDIRVAMLAPFPGGESLVKVPGGEVYYQMFSSSDEEKENNDSIDAFQAEIRKTFIVSSEIVIQSPLVSNAKELPSGKFVRPPPAAATPVGFSTAANSVPLSTVRTERPTRAWQWLIGILALLGIFVIILKRRKRGA